MAATAVYLPDVGLVFQKAFDIVADVGQLVVDVISWTRSRF